MPVGIFGSGPPAGPTGEHRMASRRNPLPFIVAGVVGVVLIIVIRLITAGGDKNNSSNTTAPTGGSTAPATSASARPGCLPVSVAASSEKAALMGKIAVAYSASGRTVNGACYDVTVRSVASGA